MHVFEYRDLPESARRTLWEYFRGGGTDPRVVQWGYAEPTLGEISREVWKKNRNMRADFRTFGAYHRWYIGKFVTPSWAKKSPTSVWAIILTGPLGGPYLDGDDIIEDGWHRFHYYLNRYGTRARVPVVWPVS